MGKLGISFFMPAFNCEKTIIKSVESIMEGNFSEGDELVIVNDGSTDKTELIIKSIEKKYPIIKCFTNNTNQGGAITRNYAIENTKNEILFCLDSDNILAKGSIYSLKKQLIDHDADVMSFQELHYFIDSIKEVNLKWRYWPGQITLADYLAGPVTPGSSGNYMFKKSSWSKAGGYPDFAGALDTWGFGFRQLATGSKMEVLPNSFYFHRFGHDSYWSREAKKGYNSQLAFQIIQPFLDLIDQADIDYIMSPEGNNVWFENLVNHPLSLRTGERGKTGIKLHETHQISSWTNKVKRIISKSISFLK